MSTLVAGVALALWGGQSLVSTFAVAAFRRGLPRPEVPGDEPSVAVILPVRGAAHLAALIPRLRAQNYRRYRIVAAVESEDDPAFAILSAAAREDGPPLEAIVAGVAENAGQKVWNQLAALARPKPDDEVVAFIDADTLPTPLWLPRLVAVLVNSDGRLRPVIAGWRRSTTAGDGAEGNPLSRCRGSQPGHQTMGGLSAGTAHFSRSRTPKATATRTAWPSS